MAGWRKDQEDSMSEHSTSEPEPSMPYIQSLAVPPSYEQVIPKPFNFRDLQSHPRFSKPEPCTPYIPPPYEQVTPKPFNLPNPYSGRMLDVPQPYISRLHYPLGGGPPDISPPNYRFGVPPPYTPYRPKLYTLPAVSMSPGLHTSFMLGVHRGQEEAAMGHNYVYSPLSIRTALGLLAGLLHGGSQHSVLSFVGCSTIGELNSTSANLIQACRPSNNEDMLRISFANGVWADGRLTLEPSFMEDSKYIYKAFVNQLDFKTQYREVREEINKWIDKETGGLIKNILPANSPDKRALLALANALYFKGTWDLGFDIYQTKVDDFILLDGSKRVKVPFMTGYSRHEFYSSHKGLKSLMLPYLMDDKDQRHLSVHILLPEKNDGLIDLAQKLANNPSFFDDHLAKKRTKVAVIKIPKFKISSKFNAADPLMKMGFSIGSLKINDGTTIPAELEAFHGATIEVNAKGTTASATTCFMPVVQSCSARPSPPELFIADHPFIYAIREDESGAILFFGHVANPILN